MLKKYPDMFVTGTDSSSNDILQITGKLKPNILLFSLGLQNQLKSAACKANKGEVPGNQNNSDVSFTHTIGCF
jgi:hypothetical protein